MEAQKEFSIEWGGRTLTIGVGLLAQQANGSCTVRYGDTVALCTATMGNVREGLDFFPLQVDFEERLYASGRIKGSRFIKREGRPTDEAVLSGRLIDRAIRPLFDGHMRNEIAVVATVLSHDQENDADVPGLIGASCALTMSDIPWDGPIAALRVGRIGGQWVLNPTYAQIEAGGVDIVVAGGNGKTIMVESGANQISEDDAYAAIAWAQDRLTPVLDLIEKVRAAVGKEKKDVMTPKTDEEKQERDEREKLHELARGFMTSHAATTLFAQPLKTKADRKDAVARLKAETDAYLQTQSVSKENRKKAMEIVDEFVDNQVTKMILDEGRRADRRALDEIRSLDCTVGSLPRTHGSGLFQRGSTQVLSAVTLGSPGMEQTLDTMEFQTTKRFFHHYNFPSYSVGETKGNRGPGRREIGHGALAERAIQPVLPTKEQFPYTLRIVSEVFGSNGSSSMGATCGSTLALMDAGVPITAPVAGIAMGMASDEATGRFRVITDLQDLEDGAGGMDFKVAGTRTGITAIQMDTKTHGIPLEVVKETLIQAHKARLQILDCIEKTIPAPRAELSKWAPRIISFRINPEKIRDVIGPGGKMINEIIAQTKVEIDIEDDGLVMITAVNPEGMQKAVDWVKQLTREVKVGEIFTGPVTRIMDFGAFVEILPKQEGLVHISEMAPYRVATVHDICKVGDMVTVKVYEIDSMGRINLSIKRAAQDYVEQVGDTKPLRDRKSGGGGGRGPDRPRFGGGGGRRDFGGGGRGPRRDPPQHDGPRPSAPTAPRPPMPDDPFDVSI
ncbi:polyribonucleotide nucleotidyltransferase [Candidatus Uhrbacteria bacterium RIFCSPHIGHO2_12_FULL_60_25]|uniref:Polyribonucleotide nucleotidyltransferase n=1 Tax=Candidatus Uhrbacteria bacterium RIFCSPHIGHO2_12_FULL_60_25 TaxID=1802399 RepID=A0A1F7UJK9_9BACT|nr:MAG: polyribonucleotide nucleotidyltransferase [Candidatus Uhrbacteria bacterium RIFCSPHIGHO2_02_FULL_60_44]OGL78449.1 MAG: polyribonucleotide nucleotidyltransferase [Candidatus Uhrbacteria bacterium RIFCSPHIGHO2_12_FULL_60_25]